jgi:hypothetical protein
LLCMQVSMGHVCACEMKDVKKYAILHRRGRLKMC